MSFIEYKQIAMSYGEKSIIEDFNLAIEQGEFVTIIGSSGCGKTTILKMVNGLIQPTGGSIYIKNKDIRTQNLISLRRNIGYAVQGSVLFPHMNVEHNISYVLDLVKKKDKDKNKEIINKWMKIVNLDESLKKRYPRELSGGQQQRVGIARAMAASPEILIMDEPFGAVDEITRSSLQDEIKSIHEKTKVTILFVTHDIREALKLGTKVLVMDQGKIIQFDTPERIKSNPNHEFVRTLLNQS